jgi:hypothetical protein
MTTLNMNLVTYGTVTARSPRVNGNEKGWLQIRGIIVVVVVDVVSRFGMLK